MSFQAALSVATNATSSETVVHRVSNSPQIDSQQNDDDPPHPTHQDKQKSSDDGRKIREVVQRLQLSAPQKELKEGLEHFALLVQANNENYSRFSGEDRSSFRILSEMSRRIQETVFAQNSLIVERLLSEQQKIVLMELSKAIGIVLEHPKSDRERKQQRAECLEAYKSGGWIKTEQIDATIGEAFFVSTQLTGDEKSVALSFENESFDQKSEMTQISQLARELGLKSPYPSNVQEMRDLSFNSAFKIWKRLRAEFDILNKSLRLRVAIVDDLFNTKNNCFNAVYNSLNALNDSDLTSNRRILQKLTDRHGNGLVMRLILEGKCASAARLVTLKISLHVRSTNNDSVFHVACRTLKSDRGVEGTELGNLLTALWENIGINELNDSGETPLHAAMKVGNDAVVSWLLKKGASLQLLCPYKGFLLSAVTLAVALDSYQSFKLIILQDETSLFSLIMGSNNFLHVTVYFSRLEFIRRLFADADVKDKILPLLEQRNEEGLTPFNLAASRGNTK